MKPSLSIKVAVTAVSVLLLSSSLVGCNKVQSEENELVIKPVKTIQVPEVSKVNFNSYIANIDATERASLSFQVSGEIDRVQVRMGEVVKKGQLLALLDQTDYQVAVEAAQAQYDLASAQYVRAKELFEKNLISADLYDQRQNNFVTAQVEQQQAKTNLGYTKLIAPYDGVVSMVFGKQAQVVGSSQPILNIVDDANMDATFSIPVSQLENRDLSEFLTSPMWVVMDSHQAIQIPAKFKEISTQPNTDTNSYQATVSISSNGEMNLLPGMTAQVKVLKPNKDLGIDVSESAWLEKGQEFGKLWRYEPETKTVEKVKVALNEQGQIISGVSAGDQLIAAGANALVEGQQVKTWTREGGI